MFGLFSSRAYQNLADHIVATSILSAKCVPPEIAATCPEFNDMFEGKFEEWIRVWSAVYIFSAVMLLSPKMSPKDLGKTLACLEQTVRNAPSLGSLGAAHFEEFMKYYAANRDVSVEHCIGSWVLEKAARRDPSAPSAPELGRSIMIPMAALHRDL